VLALPLAWRVERRVGDIAVVLAGGALGGFASFLIQSKGWLYQLTPALTYSTAAFAVVSIALAESWISSGRERRRASLSVGLCLVAVPAMLTPELGRLFRSDAALQQRQAPVLETVRHYAQGGGPALFISIEVDYTFPAVNYAGASYPYRWHHLLPMPGLYRGFEPGPDGRPFRAPEQMNSLEREFFDTFIEDAIAHPPRIVLVDRRHLVRPGLAPELDLLAYFCQSPRFAELLAGYDWLGRRGSYDVLVPWPSAPPAGGACATPAPHPQGEPSS
jgi:hypothetical protein